MFHNPHVDTETALRKLSYAGSIQIIYSNGPHEIIQTTVRTTTATVSFWAKLAKKNYKN